MNNKEDKVRETKNKVKERKNEIDPEGDTTTHPHDTPS